MITIDAALKRSLFHGAARAFSEVAKSRFLTAASRRFGMTKFPLKNGESARLRSCPSPQHLEGIDGRSMLLRLRAGAIAWATIGRENQTYELNNRILGAEPCRLKAWRSTARAVIAFGG